MYVILRVFDYKIVLLLTVVSCGNPPNVGNAMMSSPTRVTFGGTATYTCNTGYQLSGSATVTCQVTGSWNTPPSCACMLIATISQCCTINIASLFVYSDLS